MVDLILNILRDRYRGRRRHARLWPYQFPSPFSLQAQRRAEELLMSHLTQEQRETYRSHGWFQLDGRDGSRWTIRRDAGSVNVTRTTQSGTRVYCSYLEGAPRADTLLVQKLCIEAAGGRGLPRTDDGVFRDGHLLEK